MEYIPGRINSVDDPTEAAIWDELSNCFHEDEGVMAFKMPSFGENDVDSIPTFIIRCQRFGLLIVDVVSDKITEIDEEGEFWKTENNVDFYSKDLSISYYKSTLTEKLKKNKNLFNLRKQDWVTPISIQTVIIFTHNTEEELQDIFDEDRELINESIVVTDMAEICRKIDIDDSNPLDDHTLDVISSILDGSDIFSKTRRKKINTELVTINDFIQNSLNYTFKLDNIQRQIALQVPNGPQRIRGLAGTGKTVILCMKAAIAHMQLPSAKILFVFNTQSMYNQVRELITNYYINESGQQPNWSNLHILHAWGGSAKPGLYYNTAKKYNVKPKNFMEVRHHKNALDVIYIDLNNKAKRDFVGEYDIVLIDEAQDFSESFFETIYHLTIPTILNNREPSRRIIWAYDEFQSLTDLKIKQPSQMFGENSDGLPNIPDSALEGEYKGGIEKDFVLPNSYRNPRINLLVAHGLALGLYSESGKVPIESKKDWEARGYKVIEPVSETYSEGDNVIVERPDEFSRNILETLLKKSPTRNDSELLFEKGFDTLKEEFDYSVLIIKKLIEVQKVVPEEIVVINLNTMKAKKQYEYLRQQLDIVNIKAITPGYVEKADAFKEPGFVTLSTPFRAKGNEANIVIVLNSQLITSDVTFKNRNAIFVAITRSRGWCYVFGNGPKFENVSMEIDKIIQDYPYFKFTYPSIEQMRRRMTIIQSNKNIEKVDKEINDILNDEDSRALLLEKILQDPSIRSQIEGVDPNDLTE